MQEKIFKKQSFACIIVGLIFFSISIVWGFWIASCLQNYDPTYERLNTYPIAVWLVFTIYSLVEIVKGLVWLVLREKFIINDTSILFYRHNKLLAEKDILKIDREDWQCIPKKGLYLEMINVSNNNITRGNHEGFKIEKILEILDKPLYLKMINSRNRFNLEGFETQKILEILRQKNPDNIPLRYYLSTTEMLKQKDKELIIFNYKTVEKQGKETL